VSLKGAKLIDFTGTVSGFDHQNGYGDAVVKLLRGPAENKVVVVIDRGSQMQNKQPQLVLDHVNLTGANPLCGPNDPCGERFPVVNGIYLTEFGEDALDKLPRGIAGGLKSGVQLQPQEADRLRELGVDFCCYNLVPTMLIAAHAGWKVVALVVPEGTTLDEKVANCLKGK